MALSALLLAATAYTLAAPSVSGAPPREKQPLDAASVRRAPAQATLTATVVATSTATITPTPGITLTLTALATGTGTPSATRTATSAGTPTAAPTMSSTPVGTGTLSPTASPTGGTGTAEPTDTGTPNGTGTATATGTAIGSPTATPTGTVTAGGSATASATGTGTVVGTATGTGTAVGSATATPTGTLTAVGSATASATGTGTVVGTATRTPTGTGTAGTPAPTSTATSSLPIDVELALPFASLRRWHDAGNVATGIQVQNLDPAAAADLTARFIDDSGAVAATVARTAAGGGAPNFYLPTIFRDLPIPDGLFSVRVTGNRPLGAIVRTDWFSVRGAGIASNPITGADIVVASFLRRSNGRSSMVAVQNTAATTTTATVVVYGGAYGNVPRATFQLSLPPRAARRIWADFESALTPLGSFEGWLRVTGSQALSVQSWEVGSIAAGAPLPVAAFEGLPAATASDRLAVALFRSAQRGVLSADRLNTRIVVVNPGLVPATVMVSYAGSDNDAASASCRNGSFAHPAITLPPGGRHVFRQAPGGGHSIPADCFGTARIETAAPTQRVVAMVYDATNDDALLSAFVALPVADAAQRVALPLFRRRHVGLTTGIQVMNVGTTTANVQIAFSATDAATGVSTPIGGCTVCTQSVMPNQSYTWWPPNVGGIPDNTFGAAVVTADRPVIALVNDYPTSPDAGARTDPATYLGLSAP